MRDLCILLFGYNRPSHLRRLLISLENQKIKNNVYFIMDGPKSKLDKIVQKEIRLMTEKNHYLNIKCYFRTKNFGLAKSIVDGLKKIKKKSKYYLILEDDCIPRVGIFEYINTAIKLSKNNLKKNIVCCYQTPNMIENNNYLKFNNTNLFIPWGWVISDENIENFIKFYNRKNSYNIKDEFFDKIASTIKLKKNIWSLDFMKFCKLNNISFIYPSISFIKNIGFDGSGINSKVTNNFDTKFNSFTKIKNEIFISSNYKKKQKNFIKRNLSYFY